MKKKVSYVCKLTKYNKLNNKYFQDTIDIYRKAVEFIIEKVNLEWEVIEVLDSLKYREHAVEDMIHATKTNPSPKYGEFDILFKKIPSYLRRNAIDEAIGAVSSYKSNLKNYEKDRYEKISKGKKFKKKVPILGVQNNKFPTLFKSNMFKELENGFVEIKIFKNNDWVWVKCGLRNQDLKYIGNNCYDLKKMSPSFQKRGLNYILKFTFEKNINFNAIKKVSDRKVLSVDLGVNTSAVCSIIDARGTILGRKFIDMPKEKDLMYRLINRASRRQRSSGKEASLTKIWSRINNLKTEITNKVISQIINLALNNEVDVIVFEYLGKMKLKGYSAKKNKKKIHHWNKRTIIKKVCEKAHFFGIRYSLINPRNTSALAYDGSGKVKRNKNNFSLCIFKNNKIYNTDLNASYNIAARYLIREYKKTMSESKWLQAVAKVPELVCRTNTTLASLISLTTV